MSVNKFREGLALIPVSADPASPVEGQLQRSDGTHRTSGIWEYRGSAWVKYGTPADTETLTNKSIDSDNNTITNIVNTDIKAGAAIVETKLDLDYPTATLNTNTSNHIADTTDAHAASAITNTPAGNLVATEVQGALNELQSEVDTLAIDSEVVHLTGNESIAGVKTLASPVINTAISGTAIDTDITLAADSDTLLASQKAVKRYVDDNAGGAGGTGFNYITNDDAEIDTAGWATYADAAGTNPVDGTGGSPTITWTRNTTTPLRGSGDFQFTKDAANRQGEGVSYDFAIDNADLASMIKVEFDYDASTANYADDDIVIAIYDTDGAKLIPVTPDVLKGGKGTFVGYFQTDSADNNYRLIVHQSSTNATAYNVFFDAIIVGPSDVTYGQVNNYPEYNISSQVTGGIVQKATAKVVQSSDGQWRMYFNMYTILGAATTDTSFTIAGIDINGFQACSHVSGNKEGSALTSNGTSGIIYTYSTTSSVSKQTSGNILLASKPTWATESFSSDLQLSSTTQNREIIAKANMSTGSHTSSSSFQIVPFDTVITDTINKYNTSTYEYEVPETAFYDISGQVGFTANATGIRIAAIYVNGTVASQMNSDAQSLSTSTYARAELLGESLTKGDLITVYAYQSSGGSLTYETSEYRSYFSIKKLNTGSQTIAQDAKVIAIANSDSGQAVTSGSLVAYEDVLDNTHGAYAITGVFTAPKDGYVRVSALATTAAVVATVGNFFGLIVRHNGSTYKNSMRDRCEDTTSRAYVAQAVALIKVDKGDTVDVVFQETLPAVNLSPTAAENFIDFEMI